MTLGELREELLKIGIRQVGAMRRLYDGETTPSPATIFFTADEKVVVPFAMKTTYALAVKSLKDDTPINSEKYKSLMRAINRDKEKSNG